MHYMMDYQYHKFTPRIYSNLPESSAGCPFSIVLNDARTKIAFIEMRKFGHINAHFKDVAKVLWNSWRSPSPAKKVSFLLIYSYSKSNFVLGIYCW